jgi:hypothetical protein
MTTPSYEVSALPTFVDINGNYEYISSNQDLCSVIERHCGGDLAKVVSNICNKCNAVEAYADVKIGTDLDAYEEELNEWNSIGTSIKEVLSEYREYESCHKNLNRTQIDKMIRRIYALLDEMM